MYLQADPARPEPVPPVRQQSQSIFVTGSTLSLDLNQKTDFIKAQSKHTKFPAQVINYCKICYEQLSKIIRIATSFCLVRSLTVVFKTGMIVP